VLNYTLHLKLLLKRLSILLLLYFLCRVLFFFFNFGFFRGTGLWEFIRISFFGLRFDITAILLLNVLFVFLSLLPITLIGNRVYQAVLRWIFYLVNAIGLAGNCIDLIYYRYTLKRLNWDIFHTMNSKSDFVNLIPSFARNYWYMIVLYAGLMALLVYLYRRVDRKSENHTLTFIGTGAWMYSFLGFLLACGFWLLGARGGLQLIPLSISDAGEYASPQNIPLVLNSPFSILKSSDQDMLRGMNYFSTARMRSIYSPLHPAFETPARKANVVVIILESFSKEYTGIGHRKSYTPFLDSLMKESYVFNHAFANGKRSAEGIPAILAGIPTLMDEPYNSSAYATNSISSLPNLLKPLGYTSAFFHGGTDGTMNFQSFAAIAGFDKYYGRSAYNNEGDYDGHWGIWDEPFLQFFEGKLTEMKEPFLASVFTLSSHDPYLVPQKYAGRFPEGTLEVHASIGYSDYALRKFFETARSAPWFKNTIFVLTPDHTGISADPFYANNIGQYSIPICFYLPGGLLKGSDSTTIQQTDILPTLLGLLGYDKPFFAFGKNAFDKTQNHFAVNFWGNTYQLYQGNHFLEFNGKSVTGFFDMKKDSLLKNDLSKNPSSEQIEMENLLKAYLQTYEQSLVHNKMTLSNQHD
jgi:hypothetical protein